MLLALERPESEAHHKFKGSLGSRVRLWLKIKQNKKESLILAPVFACYRIMSFCRGDWRSRQPQSSTPLCLIQGGAKSPSFIISKCGTLLKLHV